jgi:predicted XRE-type DNA-binding protein
MATKQENQKLSRELDVIPVTKGSRNVFAELALPDADNLQLKAELTRQIYLRIKYFGLTQVEAATKLGLKQPDISKLMKGMFTGFSTDRLLSLLTALEVDIEILVRPRGQNLENRGTVRVLTEVG